MDIADTDSKDVDDLITLLDYEERRFGCYAVKTKDDKIMDIADTDSEDVDDPITLIDYEEQRFGCYAVKTKACNKLEDGKRNDNQYLMDNNCLEKHNECRPVSIRLVDCAKFPWYYKSNYKDKPENNVGINNNQEELDQFSSESDVDDIVCLNQKYLKRNDMHNTNMNIKKFNESTKGGTQINKSIVVNGHSEKKCLRVDFKKNIGLIGMRVKHITSTGQLIEMSNKNYSETRINVIKSNITKPIFGEKIIKRTVSTMANIEKNVSISIDSKNKNKNDCSPVLSLKRVEKDSDYFEDSNSCDIETGIGEKSKSPNPKGSIQNHKKLISALESRCKSPIISCENKIKNKKSSMLPRKEISIGGQNMTNNENNYLYCSKKVVAHEQNSELENQQKQINISTQNTKKHQLFASIRLHKFVENLNKLKLQQKCNSMVSKITNSIGKESQPQNLSNNFPDIEKVKRNTTYNTNATENTTQDKLSFTDMSHVKNFNSSDLSSQYQRFSPCLLNCDLKQFTRYDKSNMPSNDLWRFQKNFKSSLVSEPPVRYEIPHKHIRIPPVSSVLLNFLKPKQTLPCTLTLRQTMSTKPKNKTEVSKDSVTIPRANNKCTSKETINKPKCDSVSQESVQMAKVTVANKVSNQNVETKGYSPPILPIPTFQSTLEYVARFSEKEINPVVQKINSNGNQNKIDPNFPASEIRNLLGKRKLNTTENVFKKKISFEEYKSRMNKLV